MIPEEEHYNNKIDTLIRQDRSFAIWRIPGELPRFAMQASGSARVLYDIGKLDEQKGFVITPFCPSLETPIVLIEPDVFDLEEVNKVPDSTERGKETLSSFYSDNACLKQEYMQVFDCFTEPLRSKRFDKLVLSRSLTLQRPGNFSPGNAFYQACKRYTRSYVYLCHTPETGTWLGSTPEIILSGENGEWHTVALAGTQPLQNGELPTFWDEKNREEQGYVAAYIRNKLISLGIAPTETEPFAVRAGELSHLRSDFCFSIPDHKRLGDLLKCLHPTPAVCGLPKEETYRFILDNEGYDRRYYSGFIGWLDPEKRSDLYVNLRCMHIGSQCLTLYAGGGLLASSQPEEEWQETEDKLQTMRRLI